MATTFLSFSIDVSFSTGTFDGGAGNDRVDAPVFDSLTFNGGDCADRVDSIQAVGGGPATNDGGADTDTLCQDDSGGAATIVNVEILSCT
jgi:hypothetical protein